MMAFLDGLEAKMSFRCENMTLYCSGAGAGAGESKLEEPFM
jgi:hypothetical protein